MAWRQLGVLLGAMAWAAGCGGSSEGSSTDSQGAGGSSSGKGGSAPVGGASPTGGIGGTTGNPGQGGFGGDIIGEVGGSAGSNPAGGTGGAVGGTGGGPGVCPAKAPEPGTACFLDVPGPSCAYANGPSCGPGSSYTVCQCDPKGGWKCSTLAGNPCEECKQPAVAGGACDKDGAACADACGNACKCSDNVWFCSGQCTVPTQCIPGGTCAGGEACKAEFPSGCVLACECSKEGTYQCTQACPDCSPGAPCDQGTACKSISPGGCTQACKCGPQGGYECTNSCGECPTEGPVCGTPCSPPGLSCACVGDGGPVPCTCDFGPNGPQWQCEAPPDGCTQGGKCQPGVGCGTMGPDGCITQCECLKDGTYSCATSCGSPCPDKPALCGQSCEGFEGSSCSCAGKEGESYPCTCLPDKQGSSWACGDEPPPVCSPGGFCQPGETCQTQQDDCLLSCECSKGGLYQCKSVCDEPPSACPAKVPMPGTKCDQPGIKCPYDSLTVCFCQEDLSWACAF